MARKPSRSKSSPMTVLTPVRGFKRLIIRLVIWVFLRLALEDVHNLKFIHFARWVLIRRKDLPQFGGEQPVENLRDDYFLFYSNFNQSWDQYIDAFITIDNVRKGINSLWGQSTGFPRRAWPLRSVKRYLHYHEYDAELYYNAYPAASVRDIRAAISLKSKLEQFISKTKHTQAESFRCDYDHFVNDIANLLRSESDVSPDAASFERLPTHENLGPKQLAL